MFLHLLLILVMKIRLIRLVVLDKPLQHELLIQLGQGLKRAEMLSKLVGVYFISRCCCSGWPGEGVRGKRG